MRVILAIGLVCLAALAASVIASGMRYVYDADEVARTQDVFLMAQGMRPFSDYYTIYSPVFSWMLLPLFRLLGFSFQTMATARFVMVLFLAIRIGLAFFLVCKLFGKITAFLFVLLLLFDPYTVFSAMQLRPDNLMMTVHTGAVLAWTAGVVSGSKKMLFLAGMLLAVSLLTNVKIFPSAIIFSVLFFVYCISRKKLSLLGPIVLGGIIPCVLFVGYFASVGSLGDMVQQMFVDPYRFLGQINNPTQFGFFYLPNNVYIYGMSGKTLTWVYAWMLLVVGISGAVGTLKEDLRVRDGRELMRVGLAMSLGVQWLFLFGLQTVFIQYYMPIMWLLAAFAAHEIYNVARLLRAQNRQLYAVAGVIFVIFILRLGQASIDGNYARATIDNQAVFTAYQSLWKQIPEGARTFPEVLFRPIAYPLVGGYFIGQTSRLRDRYPPISQYLEKYRVPYLPLTEYAMGFLDEETLRYIDAHYVKKSDSLYVRSDQQRTEPGI